MIKDSDATTIEFLYERFQSACSGPVPNDTRQLWNALYERFGIRLRIWKKHLLNLRVSSNYN